VWRHLSRKVIFEKYPQGLAQLLELFVYNYIKRRDVHFTVELKTKMKSIHNVKKKQKEERTY